MPTPTGGKKKNKEERDVRCCSWGFTIMFLCFACHHSSQSKKKNKASNRDLVRYKSHDAPQGRMTSFLFFGSFRLLFFALTACWNGLACFDVSENFVRTFLKTNIFPAMTERLEMRSQSIWNQECDSGHIWPACL